MMDIDVSLGLHGAKAFRAAEGKISARTDFCVEIQLVEPFLKSYYFCTDSEDTLNQWVDALNSASAYRIKGILFIGTFFLFLIFGCLLFLFFLFIFLCLETCKLKGHEEKVIGKFSLKLFVKYSFFIFFFSILFFFKIVCSAYSPDGKRLITGTETGCLKVWDLKLCKVILSLEAHRNEV